MANIDNLFPCSPMMTPTQHEKNEWSRMAQHAYRTNRNSIGHTYSVAASLPTLGQIPLERFDRLQTGYRLWLIGGFADAAPFINQHI